MLSKKSRRAWRHERLRHPFFECTNLPPSHFGARQTLRHSQDQSPADITGLDSATLKLYLFAESGELETGIQGERATLDLSVNLNSRRQKLHALRNQVR